MSWHDFWVFVHILLFVYWLGADLGVLVLARRARDAALPLEQRLLLLEMAMKIDLTPRVAFVLMLPVGIQLATQLGLMGLSPWLPLAAWAVAGLWLLLVLRLAVTGGTDPTLHRLQTIWLMLLTLIMTMAALLPWLLPGVDWPLWLSGKLALYGLICVTALAIDIAFRPVARGFALLAQGGEAAGEGESLVGSGLGITIRVVLTLYALLVMAAWLGIAKPGL